MSKEKTENGGEELRFTGVNFIVCNYCVHVGKYPHRDGYDDFCSLRKLRDKDYALIRLGEEDVKQLKEVYGDAVNGFVGCEKFESSGLPAHPAILKRLIDKNPLCETIPSDPSATETSWDFAKKILEYIPEKNVIYRW